jgi:hypothetical protein
MNRNDIWQKFEAALKFEKKTSPYWPDHLAGGAGKISASSGEVTAMAIGLKYGYGITEEELKDNMENAAIRTMVNAYRFLENIK